MASPAPALYPDLAPKTSVTASSSAGPSSIVPWNNRILIAVLGMTIGTGGVANASALKHAPTSSQIQITICELKEVNAPVERALSAQEQIVGIQRYLSMNVTYLAKVLRIARPTVYAWMRGADPHDVNLERIRQLHRISRMWRSMSSIPVGNYLTLPLGGGSSLLEQLSQEQLQESAISESMARVKAALESAPRRKTIAETARARGLRVIDTREAKDEWSPDDDLSL
jgi:hypothetical protein